IYDPLGEVAALRSEAVALWGAGPEPVAASRAWEHRYHPADLLRDLQDIGTEDEATAALLIARIVERLLQSHYQLRGRWSQKPKRMLADLQQWDARAVELARAALMAGPLAERRESLERLAEHVLAPVGGLMPLEWETESEGLQP